MEVCTLRPELDRTCGPLRWRATCEHGTCTSGNWGPRNVGELHAFDELVEERLRLIQAGRWPSGVAELLTPIGAPWWDDGDELQAAFHLEELQRVWDRLHGIVPPRPPRRWPPSLPQPSD